MNKTTDITARTNDAAVVLLCTFGEIVTTPAGRIEPEPDGCSLVVPGKKPKKYGAADAAVRALRKLAPANN